MYEVLKEHIFLESKGKYGNKFPKETARKRINLRNAEIHRARVYLVSRSFNISLKSGIVSKFYRADQPILASSVRLWLSRIQRSGETKRGIDGTVRFDKEPN